MNYSDDTYDYWLSLQLDFTDNFEFYQIADYRSDIWQKFFTRIDGKLLLGMDLLLNNLRPQHQVPGKDILFLLDMMALSNRKNTDLTKKQKLKTAITLIKNWPQVMVPSQRAHIEYSVRDYINSTGLGTTFNLNR